MLFRSNLQSSLISPLVFNDRLVGTLAVYHVPRSFYGDQHRRLLERVCEQAAAVVHNSALFEQTREDSWTDPMTGLPNTRYMFLHLSRELARAGRGDAELTFMVLDLDGFKDINDTHGHRVGYRVLQLVATRLGQVRVPQPRGHEVLQVAVHHAPFRAMHSRSNLCARWLVT